MGCAAVACRVARAAHASAPPPAESPDVLGAAGATEILEVRGRSAGPVAMARALERAVGYFSPRVLLLPASPEGRVTAPYLAARLGAGLTADCTGFAVKDYTTRKAGERRTYREALYQRRPALGGNIEATIVSPRNIQDGLPQMATVRPGPTVAHPLSESPQSQVWNDPGTGEGRDADTSEGARTGAPSGGEAQDAGRVNIERCKVLVSVGRGAGGSEGIDGLARPLARALHGRFNVDVEVSASRMVVDAGDLERERQVGQTGKTVKPDIYIALGISGSAQHRAGMEDSAMIVSINADADAPIRLISDVFVHGRVEDVVPLLISTLSVTHDS